MKLRDLVCLARVVALAAPAMVAAVSCQPSQRRTDWRSPSPPMHCTTDADCGGATCAMEPGAAQGTCAGAAVPGAGDLDGGPSVRPSPDDIKL